MTENKHADLSSDSFKPAFPSLEEFKSWNDGLQEYASSFMPSGGLTKREYFAGLAMQAFVSYHLSPKECVQMAVACADLLLSELHQQKKNNNPSCQTSNASLSHKETHPAKSFQEN